MNVRRLSFALIAVAMTSSASTGSSQGFAGLGSDAQGFAVPQRGHALLFPSDHGAHPDYRIEWWYVTANLTGDDGKQYGAQWTLFRSAMAPGDRQGFADPQVWIGHAAVTTESHQFVAERLARGGVGQADVVTAPFQAWIDDWQIKGVEIAGSDALQKVAVNASGSDFSYTMNMVATGPLVLQGDRGFSMKSANGQASYYYSQPFYQVSGALKISGKPVQVSGKAWLDREWSSQPLSADQTGWDWFSLHFDSGEKLMAFRLRDEKEGYVSATWIAANGQTTQLPSSAVHLDPVRNATVNGVKIPVAWHIQIPVKSLDITTQALNDQSWMKTSTPYWEGPISFKGSASGVGYLEMTGYDK